MESVLLVGAGLFIVTHIDTLIVTSAFCADNDYRAWEILVGHYTGFCLGLAGAVIGAMLATELLEWTFLLGVIPMTMGLWGLLRSSSEGRVEELPALSNSISRIRVITVTGIGLSGENLAVLIPFFTELSPRALLLIVVMYLVGAGIVFLTASLIVQHVAEDGVSDRLDRWLVPTVLLIIGGYILVTGLVVS